MSSWDYGTRPSWCAGQRFRGAVEALAKKETPETHAAVERTGADLELVQAESSVAQSAYELATRKWELVHRRHAEELKKVSPKYPPSANFSLHVRTPLAAEATQAVPLGATMTVLDVFDTYATLNTLRREGGLSVWVVRGGKVMAVDLEAITKSSAAATNYQVRNGDKLFVQVNVGK